MADSGEREVVKRSSLAGEYDVLETVIYRGLSCIIFLGVHVPRRLQVALKVVPKETMADDEELSLCRREVELHRAIPPHSHVIQLLAADETDEAMLLVTPYTPCGDLWTLTRFGQTYCEVEVRHCAAQMLAALRHIHVQCGLIHGDIKPHNFLLFGVDNRLIVQLCDFGLAARPTRPDGTLEFHGLRGTSGWFSPEMMDHQNYGQAVDMFSTGLILFRMLGGYAPFDPPHDFREVEFDEQYWVHTSDPCRQFVARLLALNPSDRITVTDALEHEWISGPPPPEPTPEQIAAISKYGPPPLTDVLFWSSGEMPAVDRIHSFVST